MLGLLVFFLLLVSKFIYHFIYLLAYCPHTYYFHRFTFIYLLAWNTAPVVRGSMPDDLTQGR